MCVVSAITDNLQKQWTPGWTPFQPYPHPSAVTITLEQYNEYLELKKRAEEFDRKTGQPDCIKPELAQWEAMIEEVLRKKGVLE